MRSNTETSMAVKRTLALCGLIAAGVVLAIWAMDADSQPVRFCRPVEGTITATATSAVGPTEAALGGPLASFCLKNDSGADIYFNVGADATSSTSQINDGEAYCETDVASLDLYEFLRSAGSDQALHYQGKICSP